MRKLDDFSFSVASLFFDLSEVGHSCELHRLGEVYADLANVRSE